ncbi:MAG TPA: hypothetical protein VIU62_22210 [Chloroflexota bacterium]
MGAVTVGVDIGQRVDPTAIAVVDAEVRAGIVHHVARHLERLPLNTPYPQVGARVAQVVAGVARQTGSYPRLYVDATGVGTPVCDELKRAGVRGHLTPVYFTYGDRRIVDSEKGQISLGKAYLVSRLQALLQGGRLHLPKTPEAEALGRELLDYEIKVSEDANDRYGAFKVGAHDDLVTALGLATQVDPRPSTYAVGGSRDVWVAGRPVYGAADPGWRGPANEPTIEEIMARSRGW